jgi:hypothetical protein
MVIFGRGRIYPTRILDGLDKSSPYKHKNSYSLNQAPTFLVICGIFLYLYAKRYTLNLEIATLPAVARNDKNE